MSAQIHFKEPQNCSPGEPGRFLACVQEGGEVSAFGLDQRIRAAARLVFCEDVGELAGIAALKTPLDSYRFNVSRKSGVLLPRDAWPYELGWVFVVPNARNKGLSTALVRCALEGIEARIFATARTDNGPMQTTIRRFGFAAAGAEYLSTQPDHQIQLFTRPAPLR